MELKSVVAGLLPSDTREHVLGDWEQRGCRFTDLLSVLPGVWFSTLARIWTPATFPNATEELVEVRANHLTRQVNREVMLRLTVLSFIACYVVGTPLFLFWPLLCLFLRSRRQRRPVQPLKLTSIAWVGSNTTSWREFHFKLLRRLIFPFQHSDVTFFWLFFWILLFVTGREPLTTIARPFAPLVTAPLMVRLIVVHFALKLPWRARLYLEMRALKQAPKAAYS